MKLVKILLGFFLLLVSSCSNNKHKEYEPEILDSDIIVNCYTNNLVNPEKSIYMGNLLISQNGIIKAFQVNYENPKWYKVISYEYLNTHPYYKAGNQYFQNCLFIKVENEFGLIDKYQWICFNN